IERIEIGFRTKLIYHLSLEISPWWFEDANLFRNEVEHTESILTIDRELRQSKEVFIKEHYKKYHTDNRRPPAWKTIEVVSFGVVSKLYGNLKHTLNSKDKIADEMGTVNHTYLPSWLQAIAQIRNICAHHGRLWNKNLPGRPKLLSTPPFAMGFKCSSCNRAPYVICAFVLYEIFDADCKPWESIHHRPLYSFKKVS
ncbi:MAG: Abi family protein, partial [Bacteroidetes bacterium]|nr:Abi family protein [Bacteroidota bacterium]